jgi:hypothetical protein
VHPRAGIRRAGATAPTPSLPSRQQGPVPGPLSQSLL